MTSASTSLQRRKQGQQNSGELPQRFLRLAATFDWRWKSGTTLSQCTSNIDQDLQIYVKCSVITSRSSAGFGIYGIKLNTETSKPYRILRFRDIKQCEAWYMKNMCAMNPKVHQLGLWIWPRTAHILSMYHVVFCVQIADTCGVTITVRNSLE